MSFLNRISATLMFSVVVVAGCGNDVDSNSNVAAVDSAQPIVGSAQPAVDFAEPASAAVVEIKQTLQYQEILRCGQNKKKELNLFHSIEDAVGAGVVADDVVAKCRFKWRFPGNKFVASSIQECPNIEIDDNASGICEQTIACFTDEYINLLKLADKLPGEKFSFHTIRKANIISHFTLSADCELLDAATWDLAAY